jgi:hypothetical protein
MSVSPVEGSKSDMKFDGEASQKSIKPVYSQGVAVR